MWIIVEDAEHIDADIASLLMCSGIPFVYFAFGPSNAWGHVQRNAAAVVAARLAEVGIAGPGIFLDDDGYMSPWLFEQVRDLDTSSGLYVIQVETAAGRNITGDGVARWQPGPRWVGGAHVGASHWANHGVAHRHAIVQVPGELEWIQLQHAAAC